MTLTLTVSGTGAPASATRQAGAFTRAQALAAGWSPRQIERRLAAGAWVRLTHVALVSSTVTPTPATMAWALRLTWPDAVCSHWTAAALHGFPGAGDHDGIHAIVRRGLRSTATIVTHRLALEEHEVLRIGRSGPLVTTPQRTAVDCLRVLPPDRAQNLFAWLVTRRVLGRDALAAEASTSAGRWGTPSLVDLLRSTRNGALSEAERRFHAIMGRGGITGWVANAPLRLDGMTVVVDVLFAAERLVEIDGWSAHADRTAFERERRRQNVIVNAGYDVLRFTWRDLVDRPDAVLAEVRTARRARGCRFSS